MKGGDRPVPSHPVLGDEGHVISHSAYDEKLIPGMGRDACLPEPFEEDPMAMADTTKTELDLIATPPVQTRHTEQEIEVMLRVARGGNYAVGVPGGPENDKFEKAFSEKMGSADAVSVNTCSSALELAAVLSGMGPGDEVIIPAHTFVATAVPMGRTGATIRWADIDPDTRVVSVDSIRSLVNERTRAVVAVHLYGLPADMEAITVLAAEHDLIVIEDCAQANGASIHGKRVGTFGDFGCFSFQIGRAHV